MKPDFKQTRHTRKRYNAFALIYNFMEWPIELLLYRKWRKQLWQQVIGSDVLEIGVGTGKNIPWHPKNIQITGIDLAPNMLKQAQRFVKKNRVESIELVEMDAQQMTFSDNTFEEVVATFVFCSVPDPVKGLKEALRVTKPGGRLFLLEHGVSRNSIIADIMEKLDKPFHFVTGVHIARDTVKNVEKTGWTIERVLLLTKSGIFKEIVARKE